MSMTFKHYAAGLLLFSLAGVSWSDDELVLYCVEESGALVKPSGTKILPKKALRTNTYKIGDKLYLAGSDKSYNISDRNNFWIRATSENRCGFDTFHLKPKLSSTGVVSGSFEFNATDICSDITISTAGSCTAFEE